jgi:hypothetical protein
MLPIEKLKKVSHIVTHDNCSDGLASAMILRQVYPDARVTFVQYGTKELAELPAEPGMLFCDMSPPVARWPAFFDVGALVLDHHKQARDVVMPFVEQGLGVFAEETLDPGVSGAVLAYREVYQQLSKFCREAPGLTRHYNVREVANLIGIRDTWQRQDPRWYMACAYATGLRFWGAARCLDTNVLDWPRAMGLGYIVLENEERQLEETLEGAYRFTTPAGTRVVMFQGVTATSDAAEQLGDTADLVVGFGCWQGDDGEVGYTFSTRSHTTFDCGKFCKDQGGGGHTKAAGFRRLSSKTSGMLASPWSEFAVILGLYERQ